MLDKCGRGPETYTGNRLESALVRSLVSSPGRDSHNSRSSRLAEATQKALGTNVLCTGSRIFIWFLPHIYPIFIDLQNRFFLNH